MKHLSFVFNHGKRQTTTSNAVFLNISWNLRHVGWYLQLECAHLLASGVLDFIWLRTSSYKEVFVLFIFHYIFCKGHVMKMDAKVNASTYLFLSGYELKAPVLFSESLPYLWSLLNLVPRVHWLFGQREGASRDSGIMEFFIPENVGFRF